jgi:hypothetical protein
MEISLSFAANVEIMLDKYSILSLMIFVSMAHVLGSEARKKEGHL